MWLGDRDEEETVKLTTSQKALLYLHKHGPSGCSNVGTVIDNRHGRISSVNGGGDYAAQMLLGRMREQGHVRVGNSDGSSLWELTSAGLELAKKLKP